MPAASGSNLYDVFDSPAHNTLADNHAMEEETHVNANGGFSSYTGSAFDSMLEILPDATDFSLFTSNANSHEMLNGGHSGEPSASNSRSATALPAHMNPHEQQPHLHSEFDSLFGQPNIQQQFKDEQSELTQPLDVANQQNGEIAQLWDFNVDDLMMTPGGSNSATISAPNSFNSESHFQPGSAPGGPLMPSLSLNSSHELFGHSVGAGNNTHFSQFLSHGVQYANPNPSSSYFNQSASSSPRNSASQTTLKKEEINNLFRPPLSGRRSSSQVNKTIHTEDGGIPLSSTTFGNSVRKNSLARQVSSSSLTNYKRGSTSSLTDMQPKKPPLLCFNCKTQKTPLWRRDSHGNTLCNACGLFQKLHGTMRPLSLKTDVIKKRNNRKRAKKLQEQAEKNAALNENNNNNRPTDEANNKYIGNNGPRIQAKSAIKPRKNISQSTPPVGEGISPLPEMPSSHVNKFDVRYSESPSNSSLNYQQSLNSNNLMTHNKRTSILNASTVRKSRRSSTSSNNSSSSKSSSRSLVPILPKPSTTAGNQPQPNSNSANNSAASSPRVSGSMFSSSSPMTASQQGQLSSSTGRQGITIPRRKLSRNHSSSSSSFMAASLQQLQQQNQQQQQQQFNNNSSASLSNNWNQPAAGASASPKAVRSPKAGFELSVSPANSPSVSGTIYKKSHTSLLSQQLQNSEQPEEKLKLEISASEAGMISYCQQQSPLTQTPGVKRSPVTASPRNSYADSLMQHRGVPDAGLSLRRQSPMVRRPTSSREQTLSPSEETARNPTSIITTPLPSTTVTPVTASDNGNDPNTPGLRNNISDELDWLKFGM